MYLYLIQSSSAKKVKIGISTDIDLRVRSLQTGNPDNLYVRARILSINAELLEQMLHEKYATHRLASEWFNLSWRTIVKDIKNTPILFSLVQEIVIEGEQEKAPPAEPDPEPEPVVEQFELGPYFPLTQADLDRGLTQEQTDWLFNNLNTDSLFRGLIEIGSRNLNAQKPLS
jgi:hypothetical protein